MLSAKVHVRGTDGERPPLLNGDGPVPYEAVTRTSVSDGPIDVNQREMDDFLNNDARARRTVAFFEVGRQSDARDELRNGLRTATDRTRRLWTGLARVLGSVANAVSHNAPCDVYIVKTEG